MPNYCDCFLRIYDGDTEKDVNVVLDVIKNDKWPLDFETVIPYPAAWKEADKVSESWRDGWTKAGQGADYGDYVAKNGPPSPDGYNAGGFEWCCENWGTKWNAIEPKVSKKYGNEAVIEFRTAWAPPIPVISKLAEMFPAYEFQLEYYEQGMQYSGSVRWREGVIEDQFQGEYFGWRGG